MATYQTNAIVLKRGDIFETDRLYYLYTEGFGKIEAIAGGIRKINAKLAGHLEPFNLVWVELMTKKNGNLFITTALSEYCFLDKNAALNQITLLARMSDFTLKMAREPQKDKELWQFIIGAFLKARGAGTNADAFLRDYKSGLVSIMGFGDNFEKAGHYLGDFDVL